MRVTLRAPIVLSFHHAAARASAFLLLAAARGALFSYFTYVFFTYLHAHLGKLEPPTHVAAILLQAPIYASSHSIGLVVTCLRSPFHFGPYFMPLGCDGLIDPASLLAPHMRAGVFAYVLLFHAPQLLRLVAAKLSRARPGSGA